MFRCGECRLVTKPREKATFKVTATREKEYPARRKANRMVGEDFDSRDDPGGYGHEIVTGIMVCRECAEVS